jgi:hypothetical protein
MIIIGTTFLFQIVFFISNQSFFIIMNSSQIREHELRRLLYELKDKRPDICIRFRLLGEMWQSDFWRVVALTENGVVLFNAQSDKISIVKNLREVVQFEIDSRYQNFHPHDHYSVPSTLNVKERHADPSRGR